MSTTTPEAVAAGTYNVDPSHSNVGFEFRHMGIATVRGSFKKFEGTVEASGGELKLSGTVDTLEGHRYLALAASVTYKVVQDNAANLYHIDLS